MQELAEQSAFSFIRGHTLLTAPPLCPELRMWLSADAISLWQSVEAAIGRINTPPPYWAFCWPGSQVIARYLLDHPDQVRGLRVLDFAAGCGAAGLAAARAGAARVEANEIDPLAAAAILLNGAENRVEVQVLLADLLGERPREPGDPLGWDVILAGDVCYEQPMSSRAAAWLREAAGARVRVFLADPGRAFLSAMAEPHQASAPGSIHPQPSWSLQEVTRYQVPTSLDLEAQPQRETLLYRLALLGP